MRGDADEDPAEEALRTPASYIGLVASKTRGDVIRDTLARSGLGEEQLRRLVYPAGLDMGHVSDEEIALSILAQILQHRQARDTVRQSAAATSVTRSRRRPGSITTLLVPGPSHGSARILFSKMTV